MESNLPSPPDLNASALAQDNVAKDVVILSERTVPGLVRGIVADAQHLLGQQLAMIRQELRDDVHKGKRLVLLLSVGVIITTLGSALLLLMLPLLLNWAAPALPLWACFGLTGGILAALGCVLLYVAVRKIESFDLLFNNAVKAFEENLKWTTKPT